MIEIPESKNLARQIDEALHGRTIVEVVNASSPHKFAWYHGDPLLYGDLLTGRTIESARGHGMYVDFLFDGDVVLSVGDGTNIRYYSPLDPQPKKHQLLLTLDDASFLVFTVAMYGGIWAFHNNFDNPYYQGSLTKISPLEDNFDEEYFEGLFKSVKKNMSIKALLATEQRIPGLGNGVLQDILFNAGMNPRRKISAITDTEKKELFNSLKSTLQSMTDKGGRDTEKDIYGSSGKYKTILSRNTYKDPCPFCGEEIIREAYLGGNVYYCPHCQKI